MVSYSTNNPGSLKKNLFDLCTCYSVFKSGFQVARNNIIYKTEGCIFQQGSYAVFKEAVTLSTYALRIRLTESLPGRLTGKKRVKSMF